MDNLNYPEFAFSGKVNSNDVKKRYFIPIVNFMEGTQLISSASMMNVSFEHYDSNRIIPTPLTFFPGNSSFQDRWMQIQIFKCHPDLISGDEQCASEDEIKAFFNDKESAF